MPNLIMKLPNGNYIEWSTITDAPRTYGMPLGVFERFYREQYGENGMRELPERIARADRKGVSCCLAGLDDYIEANRAGEGETCLTLDEIVEQYGTIPSGS